MDIYNFGEILLEILSNGKWSNARASRQNKPMEVLLTEVLNENEVVSNSAIQEKIKLVLEVALLYKKYTNGWAFHGRSIETFIRVKVTKKVLNRTSKATGGSKFSY